MSVYNQLYSVQCTVSECTVSVHWLYIPYGCPCRCTISCTVSVQCTVSECTVSVHWVYIPYGCPCRCTISCTVSVQCTVSECTVSVHWLYIPYGCPCRCTISCTAYSASSSNLSSLRMYFCSSALRHFTSSCCTEQEPSSVTVTDTITHVIGHVTLLVLTFLTLAWTKKPPSY